MDDRKKLGMDFADPMNRSEWRGCLRGRLLKQAQPSVEENRLLNGYDDDDDWGAVEVVGSYSIPPQLLRTAGFQGLTLTSW